MSYQHAADERTPLYNDDDAVFVYEYQAVIDDDDEGSSHFQRMKPSLRQEALAAEHLSVRLLAIDDDDEEAEELILMESLRLAPEVLSSRPSMRRIGSSAARLDGLAMVEEEQVEQVVKRRVWVMVLLAIGGLILLSGLVYVISVQVVGPPNQPVGAYQLVERQEGEAFFDYYTFYEGRDSAGSNGYNMYIGQQQATEQGMLNVTREPDVLDVYHRRRRTKVLNDTGLVSNVSKSEPFVYMGSKATPEGPRDSIRLEGNRRFNRGLFIIDVRHMPAGCGVWPAFWLTDEANWPVNGEIDIVEGVNYQSEAKTALHATTGCSMADIPLGTMTGTWDTAQGIPDAKTGIPDMTLRYARNCFVYDPHQWLNQGCVAVDSDGGSLGVPLNEKGGGVYALEWDPINRHIRTWVFSPHTEVPDNLLDSIRTAGHREDSRVAPDPDQWPLPYGYFAIGDGTDCPASHFRHMRLVFNLAFCGSVAGNRFHLDCKKQAQSFDTCNDWIESEPEELNQAYWKIRGVYVYERQWERTWIT